MRNKTYETWNLWEIKLVRNKTYETWNLWEIKLMRNETYEKWNLWEMKLMRNKTYEKWNLWEMNFNCDCKKSNLRTDIMDNVSVPEFNDVYYKVLYSVL